MARVWKSGPKQFKLGPRPTGRERLNRRVQRLLLDAARLHRRGTPDAGWAAALVTALQRFNAGVAGPQHRDQTAIDTAFALKHHETAPGSR